MRKMLRRLSLCLSQLQTKTVKVSNVSLGASEQDIKEFFSFSGDIEYVEMKRSASLPVLLSGCFFSSSGSSGAP